jgi:hypothetical protein
MRLMQRQLNISIVILIFLVAISVPQLTEAAGFLRIQGQNMVDENGNTVLLRGVGLGNWLLPEGFELLDNLVKWCNKYNVYVIIDIHGALSIKNPIIIYD